LAADRRRVGPPAGWLNFRSAHSPKASNLAAEPLELDAYKFIQQKRGRGDMNSTIGITRLMANRWSFGADDLLIVSAFGLWSAILGISPILLLRALAVN
jgi:hypothetical protein